MQKSAINLEFQKVKRDLQYAICYLFKLQFIDIDMLLINVDIQLIHIDMQRSHVHI